MTVILEITDMKFLGMFGLLSGCNYQLEETKNVHLDMNYHESYAFVLFFDKVHQTIHIKHLQ